MEVGQGGPQRAPTPEGAVLGEVPAVAELAGDLRPGGVDPRDQLLQPGADALVHEELMIVLPHRVALPDDQDAHEAPRNQQHEKNVRKILGALKAHMEKGSG